MLPSIGPTGDLLGSVRKIAVLRGGGLGDLIFTLPAIESLSSAYPNAEITVLGTRQHAELLDGRFSPVHQVMELPVSRGVYEPTTSAIGANPSPKEFFQAVAAENFDLAVQMHGGGRWSNPFLLRVGARHTAGTKTPDAQPLERWLPYLYYQHESLRWLEVAGLVGARVKSLHAHLTATKQDLHQGTELLTELDYPVVTMHPGATDRRRWWPAQKFANTAAQLLVLGYSVCLIGDNSEAELGQGIVNETLAKTPAQFRGNIKNLTGKLDLTGLVGILAQSSVLVANDSGPRHLAEALGTPTVGIFWCGNLINAGPIGRGVHRVEISWTVLCPQCGSSLTSFGQDCDHLVSWMAEVPVDSVIGHIQDLLTENSDYGGQEPSSA